MASYQWIKLYDEILDDPKMGRLSDGAYRFCINLFLLASRQEARDGSLPELTDVSWALRLPEDTAAKYWAELEKVGIVCTKDGVPTVCKFQDRQKAADGKERVKQFRDRQQRKPVTPENEPETDATRGSNESVTESYTDIDKKKKKRKRRETPTFVLNMITAISAICAQTYSQSTNHQEFEDAAYGLIGVDITPEDVALFGQWWGRGNGFHKDKPFIKNILSQIKGAKDNGWKDVTKSYANGKTSDSPEFTQTWQTLKTFMASHGADRKPVLSPEVDALVRKAGGWYQLCMMNQTEAQNRLRSFCNV